MPILTPSQLWRWEYLGEVPPGYTRPSPPKEKPPKTPKPAPGSETK